MNICPICAEQLPEDVLKCEHCGGIVANEPVKPRIELTDEAEENETEVGPRQPAPLITSTETVEAQYKKVGGWLLLLCFGLIVGPFKTIKSIDYSLSSEASLARMSDDTEASNRVGSHARPDAAAHLE